MAILTIYQLINQSMPWRRNLLVLSKLSYTNLIPQIQINTTGFSKNPHHKVLLGFSSIVLSSNMLEGWYIFHSKGGSIAASGVQNHLCMISRNRDIIKKQALARSATLEDTSLARRTTEQIRCLRIRWGDITHSN